MEGKGALMPFASLSVLESLGLANLRRIPNMLSPTNWFQSVSKLRKPENRICCGGRFWLDSETNENLQLLFRFDHLGFEFCRFWTPRKCLCFKVLFGVLRVLTHARGAARRRLLHYRFGVLLVSKLPRNLFWVPGNWLAWPSCSPDTPWIMLGMYKK